jgi:hypothetical protein
MCNDLGKISDVGKFVQRTLLLRASARSKGGRAAIYVAAKAIPKNMRFSADVVLS